MDPGIGDAQPDCLQRLDDRRHGGSANLKASDSVAFSMQPLGLPGGSRLLSGGALTLHGSHQELDRARANLSTLVEHVPAMIFVKNAQTLRFELFSNAAEHFLGVPRTALLGKSDADFFPRDQVAWFAEKDRGVLNEGKALDIPREPIDTAQGRRWLHTRKIPVLDKQGNARYLLGISLEVTRRRRDTKAVLGRLHAELEQRLASLGHADCDARAGNEPWQARTAAELEVVYQGHAHAIFARCRYLLGSSAAGEDATQEVFIRALGQAGHWPPAIELRPWLLRIATNYCLNELRSRRVRADGPPQLAMVRTGNLEDALLARSDVAALLRRLPERARDVARLTYVEGMRQQEVAQTLGVSRRTVVSCLTQLRSCL
jgi:RNA polymerase sigma factor (sigma-70 family)